MKSKEEKPPFLISGRLYFSSSLSASSGHWKNKGRNFDEKRNKRDEQNIKRNSSERQRCDDEEKKKRNLFSIQKENKKLKTFYIYPVFFYL